MAPSLAPAGVLTIEELRSLPAGDVTDAVMGRAWAWRTPGWRGARPTVLAIDPGKKTGWASIVGSTYVGGTAAWSARWFTDRLSKLAPDLVLVEDGFLGRDPRAFQRLAWQVGAVRALAELGGCRVLRVGPPTWQAAMLGGKSDREAGKAKSLDIARRRVSTGVPDDNAADAALMALWARGV